MVVYLLLMRSGNRTAAKGNATYRMRKIVSASGAPPGIFTIEYSCITTVAKLGLRVNSK